jgi:uncharacterized membrane protein
MTEFSASTSVSIDAPVEEVFAYVNDYRNVTQYMEGVVVWEPINAGSDPADHGVGTVYRLVLRGGPKKFTSEVEITQGVDNELLHWEPRSGLRNTGTWRLEPDGRGTKVTFEQTIVPPGGVAGKLLAQSLEPVIRAQYRRSLATLKQQLEARVEQPQPVLGAA